jgi:hypothetical protein
MAFIFLYLYLDKYLNIISNDKIKFEFSTHKLLNYAYRLYQLSKLGISPLMNDYLDQKNNLHLYNRFPTLENFEGQILEKQANFDDSNRVTLVSVLQKQYAGIETLI